jgi:hypothetical protein
MVTVVKQNILNNYGLMARTVDTDVAVAGSLNMSQKSFSFKKKL